MKALIVCIDGGDPAYFTAAPIPHLDRLGREGWRGVLRAQMPTVTNVNNVSLVCGGPPSLHGITANYFLDPETQEEIYMESGEFLRAPTLMERGATRGRKTAALASKEKLCAMIGKGAATVVTAEAPPPWLIRRAGPKEEIYSAEVNFWLLRAAFAVVRERRPDLLYVTTTDYSQHMHGPESAEGQAHLAGLDREIGRLADAWSDLHPDGAFLVTADHGMGDKRRALDPGRFLRRRGIAAEAVPIIKDRYVVHHGNQGGSAYVHLRDPDSREDALAALREAPGVEEALPRESAAARFRLMAERVGDIMILADRDTVFGVMETVECEVALRSHGSLHEEPVPLFAWRAPFFRAEEAIHHFDAVRAVMSEMEEG